MEELLLENGLTNNEVLLVSCPSCGSPSTYMCTWPSQNDPSSRRARSKLHGSRINKAYLYRAEHRI